MDARQLADKLNIDPLVAELLCKRGFDDEASARAFLHPSLDALTPTDRYDGLAEIADRLEAAIADDEGIVVYGDYDCDGVCATSILYLYLRSRGARVSYFIPNRHSDGYGISVGVLEKIAENTDARVIISVDCGITSVAEVEYAQDELGFEMLITDHHQPADELPDCPIFDPHLTKREDCFKPLCGAGVALRIVEKMGGLQASKKYYDIAALATVADVVPLIGDNRIIAHFGLMLINSRYRKGLTMLAESCVKGQVGAYDIAFRLAPRINAMGRVKDANAVIELFTSDDKFLLELLVKEINEANDVRQQLTDDLTEDCLDKLKKYDFSACKIIVAYAPYWDEGVLGIAAARVVSEFSRPTILLTKSGDRLKGSGRSVKGVNILECVRACASWLKSFGGHPMACGISLAEEDLASFTLAINEYAASHYPDTAFEPHDGFDAVIDKNVTSALAAQINLLAPFGEGNPSPVFALDCGACGFVPIGDGSHLKTKLYGMDTLYFFGADSRGYLNDGAKKRLLADISCNVFNNVERAQAVVRKVIPCEPAGKDGCAEYLLSAYRDGERECDGLRRFEEEPLCGYGTAYVAFDPERGAEFARRHGLRCVYGAMPDSLPENAVIVCPYKPLAFYRRVVFADEPIFAATAVRLADGAEVFTSGDTSYVRSIAAQMPDRDGFASVYRAIRRESAEKPYSSPRELYGAVAGECGCSYIGFCICFYVFAELKFLDYNGTIECRKAQKTPLDQSRLYAALSAIKAEQSNG